jgi:hypothetical protein
MARCNSTRVTSCARRADFALDGSNYRPGGFARMGISPLDAAPASVLIDRSA